MSRIYAIASVILIALLLAGAGIAVLMGRMSGAEDQFAQCRGSAIAGGGAQLGGPFTLVSETGDTVTDADVVTGPTILYFGYTFCPDVCPLDTVRNAEAVDILDTMGHEVLPVMISVDPERDTPEVMAAFTDNVHPRMLGLTGTLDQTDAAADAYRVYYRVNREGDDPYYLVDHSAFSYLVLPEHGFVEFFNRETTPRQMADTTACFIEAAAGGS
ncbi:Cytochrome oxidase biogenesis protein Sco1/SenC/PrrC, putative copper metallochaperone [Roseibacterium elongatum DSM 19469]|uniref:Cytochrome oxidase biogenesis protein Sco1/SenC/PrrC, putative copper metallochaperone n=1 Tax=Roseicyclus elongatus DSM 19469 TaxID=1294273 RepID=W8S4N6_9RHOB|nr:SCO family protein [Roseibacterium elongatum]AHM03776.1 Cytochrome oxidase biogenesis protein Sco1/SenC/PrrC, putative copper metallochaperone [Roseibacterium elongatum DSM 19469]